MTTVSNQVLSDTNLEKVCLITDINKLAYMLYEVNIDADMFDELYDSNIQELELLNDQLVMIATFRNQARSLRNALLSVKNQARKNNEEGD